MTRRWRPDEDDRLRSLYRAGTPLAVIARELERSEDALVARRGAIGLKPRRPSRGWSPLEDALLRKADEAGLPTTRLAPRIHRPVGQVRARRRQLELGRPPARPYTRTEDEVLRAAWPHDADVDTLAQQLDRSADALRLHARQLGLHQPARRRRWRVPEDAILRDGYANGLTCSEIASGLTQRTPTAVAARARKLGLATYARRWTNDDDNRLRRILAVRSVDHATQLLGRTPEAIRRRARKLGLPLTRSAESKRAGARWTSEEDELLCLHAGLNPAVLSGLVGRSDQAVVARLRRLELRAGRRRSPHHPSPACGGLTHGERRLVERELQGRGSSMLLTLEQRLQKPLGAIRDYPQGGDTDSPDLPIQRRANARH